MKNSVMHNTSYDPVTGLLEFILCWSFYVAGVAMPVGGSFNLLQTISFVVSILVGTVNLLKILGVDVNIKKRFKKKHHKK